MAGVSWEKEGGFLLRLKDAPENLCLYVFHLLLCPEVISYHIEAWQRKGQSGMSQHEAGSRQGSNIQSVAHSGPRPFLFRGDCQVSRGKTIVVTNLVPSHFCN